MSVAAMIREMEQENATTRRVLERVPNDKLSWKPHPKSMSLGELALHVAMSPGYCSAWALQDTMELGKGGGGLPQPTSVDDILKAHDESVSKTQETLTKIGDEGMQAPWKAVAGEHTIFAMPKVALIRSIVMNHSYHHRGQLSVYLRLLDVPVPSIYGPSADEQPQRVTAQA
jgi:uncharacterized damage-inducible protein DinB